VPPFSWRGRVVTLEPSVPSPPAGTELPQHHTSTFLQGRLRRMAMTFTVVVLVGVLAAPIGATALVIDRSSVAARGITVTPAPGSILSPGEEIAFRGLPAHHLRVTVTGSSSGFHTGILHPDHDLLGATFVPDRPLTPGEALSVTVRGTHTDGAERNLNLAVATRAPTQPAEARRR
jgi:hypothetical protein